MRGVFYVVRWKRNIKLEVVSERPVEKPEAGKRSEAKVRVLKDEIVKPAMPGGAYRSSAYSRTQVATRIFEHYELAPMRSGMVVVWNIS